MSASNRYSITGHIKIFGIISAGLCSLTILGIILTLFGIPVYKTDIDLSGGVQMDIELGVPLTNELAAQLKEICLDTAGVSVSVTESRMSKTGVSLMLSDIPLEVRQQIFIAISEKYGTDEVKLLDTDYMSTSSSNSIKRSLAISFLLTGFIIIIYFSARFGAKSGYAAIICIIQNILVMLLAYAIFRIPLNTAFSAAVLMIIAFSLIEIILVFDAVRENKKLKTMPAEFSELIDISILQSLRRNLNVMLIALFLVAALFFIKETKSFALPLIVGIVAATYSSILMSGSLWSLFIAKRK